MPSIYGSFGSLSLKPHVMQHTLPWAMSSYLILLIAFHLLIAYMQLDAHIDRDDLQLNIKNDSMAIDCHWRLHKVRSQL